MTAVVDPVLSRSHYPSVPFGRLVSRSREDNRPDLESLSVFLGQGVVPRTSRDDNHNRLGADLSKYLVVHPNDLVFNKLRTWQGGFGRSRYEGIVSPAYFVCRPEPGVDTRYLHLLLLSAPYRAELTRLSKFMPPSQFDIMWDDLKLLPIPVPPIATQRAIADHLDAETARIDALIEKKKRMVELLEQRFIAWRERNFITDASVTWTPLHHLTDTSRPIVYGIVQAGEEVVDGVPYIKTGDVADLRVDHLSRTSAEIDHAYRRARVHPGDIVIAMRASIGLPVMIPPELPAANLTQGTARVAAASGVDARWLIEVIQCTAVQQECNLRAVGTTFKTLNIWDLRRVSIPTPSAEEQARLATLVAVEGKKVRDSVSALARQIDLLVERRQALITAAVTGELVIPGVAA